MSRTALIGSDRIGGNSAEASGSSACFAEGEEVSSSIFSGIISEHLRSLPARLMPHFLWICGEWVQQFLSRMVESAIREAGARVGRRPIPRCSARVPECHNVNGPATRGHNQGP